jgi:hypothetical protein
VNNNYEYKIKILTAKSTKNSKMVNPKKPKRKSNNNKHHFYENEFRPAKYKTIVLKNYKIVTASASVKESCEQPSTSENVEAPEPESIGWKAILSKARKQLRISDVSLSNHKKSDRLVSLKNLTTEENTARFVPSNEKLDSAWDLGEILNSTTLSETNSVATTTTTGSTNLRPVSLREDNREQSCENEHRRSLASWDFLRGKHFDRNIFKRYGNFEIYVY